ncbi:MAG: hypothetical protein FWG31_03015 [Oscillospiraceae bacterium]|nr:hypothetical protein [Oscillospiraceae bacterium]
MEANSIQAEQEHADNILNARLTQFLLYMDKQTPGDDNINYKSLYYFLFNGIYDVVEKLIQLQCDAEERLMSQSDENG